MLHRKRTRPAAPPGRLNPFFLIGLWLSVVVVGLPAAGGREPGSTGAESLPGQAAPSRELFPVTLIDDAGVEVTVERPPGRIISLTSFTDEILLELVELGRLVGVTVFSEDPDISNVAERARAVEHKLELNVEIVLALRPDLVLVANWSDASEVAQLRNAGVPVFLIATGVTVGEIQSKIRTVARLVGEVERGQEMIREMEARLAEVSRRVSTLPADSRLSVMDYTTWGSSQGRGSSWDEIVRRAGLINAVAEQVADDWGQVALSKEMILQLDPDLLILPGWVYGNPQGAQSFYESIVKDPALQNLRAVRRGQVYRMPEALRAATSQYTAEAVEYLARLAYPERWED